MQTPAGDDDSTPALRHGECLQERFVIERELGRGSRGAVFLARDQKLNRNVAIKVLQPGISGPNSLARFELEARAAGALEHPNVLGVHDVGLHNGAPYIVYEMLEGSNLRHRLEQGPLSAREALGLALQLAQGLAATHEKGIVHRDLKPENLFLVRGGRLKILDFGVAKLMRPEDDPGMPPRTTRPGGMIGTIPYMSPEQARGAPADARSDVFTFGAILYEMLMGKMAFARGSNAETAYAIINETSPKLPVSYPLPLRKLVGRCLAKDPDQRVQSADELVRFLQSLLSSPDLAPPRPWPIRTWALAAFALLGAAALLAAVASLRESWLHPAGKEKRLAVLPFHALAATADGEALTAGLSEILTGKLQQIEQFQKSLRVVSVSDVLKENVRTPTDARAAFGATLALTGTVQWTESTVTVATTLVDTRTRLVIAARDLVAPREDVSTLSTLLLQQAGEMLAVTLEPEAQRTLGIGARESPAYELYVEGRGYLQRSDNLEDVDHAIDVFDQALLRDPGYAPAHASRAEAFLRRFRTSRDVPTLEQARASSQRALELDPKLAQVQFTSGLVHASAGESQVAIERFRDALRIEPSSIDALRELAHAYDAAGKAAQAEATLLDAAQNHPDSWAVFRGLGAYYVRHGRLQDALPWFQRVVALTPDSYFAYSNLGVLYFYLRRQTEAGAALRRSIALRPTGVAYYNLGTIRYYEGAFAEASDAFRKATQLSPSDDRVWGALADALREVPDSVDEMAGAYRQAIALAERQAVALPHDAELRSRLAMYRALSGDGAGADSDMREALRLDPADGTVLSNVAVVNEKLGRRADALDALERALRAGYSREVIGNAPAFRELRSDPRYARLGTNTPPE